MILQISCKISYVKKVERNLNVSKQDLILLIEQKRGELIQVALKYGFTSSLAVRNSQELDRLLNEYNKISNTKVPTH
ncbi:aspartyl-phosphate phosphatase Spo0E family protein [Cytobacillus eiseniae]|uniref:aspartyl-phosphate phosphatase Spo0E family protein n=1 Tax=Cytobacillus eiseniae TaxID=762947 RepID=UPI000AB3F818